MEPSQHQQKQPIPSIAKRVFQGVIFDVYQWPQKLYDGRIVTFEGLRRPASVNIIPVATDQKIIIGRQRQPGMEHFTGTLSGRADAGEEPLDAAKRELAEEGGFTADAWKLWDIT